MKNTAIVATLIAAALAGCATEDNLGSAKLALTESKELFSIVEGANVAGSQAKLDRSAEEFEFEVETTATAGDAYTVWVCGFDAPENCSGDGGVTASCSLEDLFGNAAAEGYCQWGGGEVADGEGELEISGTDDANGAVILGDGIDNNLGEIALVVRSHGPALSGDDLVAQLGSFNGGCPPNTCEDQQIASF